MNKKIMIFLICVLLVLISVTVGIVFRNDNNIYTNTTKPYNPVNMEEGKNNDVAKRIAECNYNNEQLTLLIPSTWSYEIVENQANTSGGVIVDSNYGIKFYPDVKNKEKNVEIYNQRQKFGVCGTGLKTEKMVTQSGIEASIGYFNEGKDWDYVAFNCEDAIIVAYNNGLEDDIAKEALEILKTMYFVDNSNVEMTIKEGTLTNTSVTLIMKAKDKTKYFSTGEWFEIEKKQDGVWVKLPVDSMLTWNEIAYIPNEEGIIELKVNWKYIYGELEKGEYRILKEIVHKVYVYAEFSI